MRRILGTTLIALPIVVFLTCLLIKEGWGYVITIVVMTALWVGRIVGGIHLRSPKSHRRGD